MFERFILLIVALFAVVCNAEPEPAKIEQSRLAFIEKLYDENVDLFRQTFAATGVSEEEIAELSEKHQLSIDFEIYKSREEFDVYVDSPTQIEGQGFSRIAVFLVNGAISFMAPLFAAPKGEKLHTWFVVRSDLSPSNKVQVTYGTPCGLMLEYDIPFSEAKE